MLARNEAELLGSRPLDPLLSTDPEQVRDAPALTVADACLAGKRHRQKRGLETRGRLLVATSRRPGQDRSARAPRPLRDGVAQALVDSDQEPSFPLARNSEAPPRQLCSCEHCCSLRPSTPENSWGASVPVRRRSLESGATPPNVHGEFSKPRKPPLVRRDLHHSATTQARNREVAGAGFGHLMTIRLGPSDAYLPSLGWRGPASRARSSSSSAASPTRRPAAPTCSSRGGRTATAARGAAVARSAPSIGAISGGASAARTRPR